MRIFQPSPALLFLALLPACSDDGGGSGDGTTGAETSETNPSSTSVTTTPTSTSTSNGTVTTTSPSTDTVGTGTDTDTGSSTGTGTDTDTDCNAIIVEVFADPEGDLDMLQWVQLHNPCGRSIDLSTHTLAWGGPDYVFGRKQLVGSFDPGGCFIVGGPMSAAQNANPIIDLPDDFAPDLRIAGVNFDDGVAAGVALFDVLTDDIDPTTVPIDAVVYGVDNSNGLIDETGNVVDPPNVGDPPEGQSLLRTSLGKTWVIGAPAPGACPGF